MLPGEARKQRKRQSTSSSRCNPTIYNMPSSKVGVDAGIITQPSLTNGVRRRRMRERGKTGASTAVLLLFAASIPVASTQACIPLATSTQCSAFNASSISTDSSLTSLFPFLAFVSTTKQFDDQLSQYVTMGYVQQKYQQLLGCTNVTLTNTTDYYARYTTSVICNSIVQNSIQPCSLSTATSRPLCAESCAQQATSEENITVNPQLCGTTNPNYVSQIRADFTNCALPANSLSGSCITGVENEPDNCGFSTNLQGLCGFCATSSPNATDSCCVGSNVDNRCTGVTLPSVFPMPPFLPSSTSSSTPSATNSAAGATNSPSSSHHGLSAGQIAGIVIGSVLGAALLLGLLVLCCICIRRRRDNSPRGSIFNQPSLKRGTPPPMASASRDPGQVVPGGRVARMSALEGPSSDDPQHGDPVISGEKHRRYGDTSDSDIYGDSPGSRGKAAPPNTGKRNGSLSSNSIFGGGLDDSISPNSGSGGQYSSPEGVASGQSEQLAMFKDYYSQDEIHPNDKVATLWAYQPRAGDEFELERGDMLKVVGIWDDGWATGVRINERAEDYDGKHKARDSGVSNGSGRRDQSPPPTGEIKAFPLVCVCLPEHWKKTIDGDGMTEGAMGMTPPTHGP